MESETKEKRYIKGYKRNPECVFEVEPFFKAGLSSFAPDYWCCCEGSFQKNDQSLKRD